MSIINEALKKSGQPILTEVKEPSKRRSNPWGPLFVAGVLLVVATPIVTPLLGGHKNAGERQMPVGPDLSRPQQARQQFGIETAALPRAAAAPSNARFAMNGLVYSSGTSYALINGKVLTVGESVNGARLLEITPDGAVLEYRGQRILLPAGA